VKVRPVRRSSNPYADAPPLPEIVGRLRTVLGRNVVAAIVEQTSGTVGQWATGDAEPPAREERLLRAAFEITELIGEVDADEVIRAWFMGMNPQLGDESPVETLREGRVREAMAAARAYVNAG
jgi:hypothetical protein